MTKIVNYPYLMSFSKSFDEMVTIARNLQVSTGREVCGVIGGKLGQIFECALVENVSPDASTFLMDPVGMSRELDALDAKGYELIALFHTHPGGPAQPSGTDLEKRSIDVPMIIITPTELKAWRFKNDGTFDEVRLAIHNPGPKVNIGPIKELRTDGLRITLEVSGKVFEELPGILKSWLGNRNGRAFEDRMQDVQSILELVRMGQTGLRDGDDPDHLISQLTRNPNQGSSSHAPSTGTTTFGGTMSPCFTFPSPSQTIPNLKQQPPSPAPHTHRYKKVSKDGEGRNIFECTFEKCDKSLTIDGDLVGLVGETGDTKIEAVAAEFKIEGDEQHGKERDTAGKGADPEAGQETRGPGGAG